MQRQRFPLRWKGRSFFASSERLADGHDHAGGAEAALERLGVEKRLLHRMQFAVAGEPLERGDLAALGAEGGNEATVDRLAVEPDRARAAIAGVTPFLHSKPAEARAGRFASTGRDAVPPRMICR